jgi:hypothetical protein
MRLIRYLKFITLRSIKVATDAYRSTINNDPFGLNISLSCPMVTLLFLII